MHPYFKAIVDDILLDSRYYEVVSWVVSLEVIAVVTIFLVALDKFVVHSLREMDRIRERGY